MVTRYNKKLIQAFIIGNNITLRKIYDVVGINYVNVVNMDFENYSHLITHNSIMIYFAFFEEIEFCVETYKKINAMGYKTRHVLMLYDNKDNSTKCSLKKIRSVLRQNFDVIFKLKEYGSRKKYDVDILCSYIVRSLAQKTLDIKSADLIIPRIKTRDITSDLLNDVLYEAQNPCKLLATNGAKEEFCTELITFAPIDNVMLKFNALHNEKKNDIVSHIDPDEVALIEILCSFENIDQCYYEIIVKKRGGIPLAYYYYKKNNTDNANCDYYNKLCESVSDEIFNFDRNNTELGYIFCIASQFFYEKNQMELCVTHCDAAIKLMTKEKISNIYLERNNLFSAITTIQNVAEHLIYNKMYENALTYYKFLEDSLNTVLCEYMLEHMLDYEPTIDMNDLTKAIKGGFNSRMCFETCVSLILTEEMTCTHNTYEFYKVFFEHISTSCAIDENNIDIYYCIIGYTTDVYMRKRVELFEKCVDPVIMLEKLLTYIKYAMQCDEADPDCVGIITGFFGFSQTEDDIQDLTYVIYTMKDQLESKDSYRKIFAEYLNVFHNYFVEINHAPEMYAILLECDIDLAQIKNLNMIGLIEFLNFTGTDLTHDPLVTQETLLKYGALLLKCISDEPDTGKKVKLILYLMKCGWNEIECIDKIDKISLESGNFQKIYMSYVRSLQSLYYISKKHDIKIDKTMLQIKSGVLIDCCICCESNEYVELVCNHNVCFGCVIKCMESSNTCPCCRQMLEFRNYDSRFTFNVPVKEFIENPLKIESYI